jgi:hypothetical protein
MKSFAIWVMKGRMQAVIAATVLAVLALIVTPLALLSSAVVMLAVLRQGWREGMLVVGSSLLAIAGLGGLVLQMPVAALLVGLMLWLPAAALGGVLGRTGSLRLAIEAATVGAALIVFAQHLLMADPAGFWRDALNQFLLQQVDSETLAQANAGPMIDAIAGWMPGGIAATWLIGSVLSLLLARWWSSLIDRPGGFGEEFRALRFGRWLLLLVPVLLAGGVLLSGGKPNIVAHLYLLGMVVFLIQGISVVHALVNMFGASPGWLVGLYLLLVFIAPQGAPVVAVAGYAAGWLDTRARARARRGGSGDA